MPNMYDNITGRSPIATDDLGYIGTGNKATDIISGGGFSPTQQQLDAMNSGITTTKVDKLDSLASIKSIGTGLSLDSTTGLLVATGGSGGTSDYTELVNKPQINNVILSGNKTASDLGFATVSTTGAYSDLSGIPNLANVATSGSYLDLTNTPSIPAAQVNSDWNAVSGVSQILNKPTLGTAAAANTTDFATASQGSKADTAVQPATLAGYQTVIDSSHKLSSDLVDDTGHTNKFATATQLSQIETNKNNILTLEFKNGSKNYLNYDKTILQSLNTGGSWVDNVWTLGNGVTLAVNANNSITLNGTATAGKTIYLAKNLNMPSDVYILSMTTALITKLWAGMSAVGGGEYNFTSPSSYISQSCQANNITIYIDTGCVLDNITIYPMLCDDESWSLSHSYQQYAMSNAEITAWIKAHS